MKQLHPIGVTDTSRHTRHKPTHTQHVQWLCENHMQEDLERSNELLRSSQSLDVGKPLCMSTLHRASCSKRFFSYYAPRWLCVFRPYMCTFFLETTLCYLNYLKKLNVTCSDSYLLSCKNLFLLKYYITYV